MILHNMITIGNNVIYSTKMYLFVAVIAHLLSISSFLDQGQTVQIPSGRTVEQGLLGYG